MSHLHPPKVELFDVDSATNTDPKGFVRAVDEFRVRPFGLYMAREVVDHPRIAYLESWLLPGLRLRVNDIWLHPAEQQDWDTYIDVAHITDDGGVWRTVDLYVDLGLRTGRGLDVLDTDELTEALAAGLVGPGDADSALRAAFDAVGGIAANGYRLADWLATRDITLTWKRR